MDEFKSEFDLFYKEFDMEMDFHANRAEFMKLLKGYEDLSKLSNKKPFFLEAAKFSLPRFETVKSDLEDLLSIGKVSDTSPHSMPMVVLNTYSF